MWRINVRKKRYENNLQYAEPISMWETNYDNILTAEDADAEELIELVHTLPAKFDIRSSLYGYDYDFGLDYNWAAPSVCVIISQFNLLIILLTLFLFCFELASE